MMDEELTIQDLCDQTGLPRRTIHFYTQQGIIPPPQGSGLGARYQEGHLLRLNLIPYFRKQGLRLDEIRHKFQTSSTSELKEIQAKNQSSISEPPSESYLPLPSQKSGQAFTAYTLPHGMILMVPESNNYDLKSQLQKIFRAVQPEGDKEH
jgi:DNA-binding transcriptional MerR regulator